MTRAATDGPPTVILIGLRGSGKTTVGRRLAERLGWEFLDADDLVERRAGRTIRAIFAAGGEAAFRALERDVLEDVARPRAPRPHGATARGRVLSVGGGAVGCEATRRRLAACGVCVWLTAEVETLVERIERDPRSHSQRPPLRGTTPRDDLVAALAERRPLYAHLAALTLDTTHRTVDEVAEAIAAWLARGCGAGQAAPPRV